MNENTKRVSILKNQHVTGALSSLWFDMSKYRHASIVASFGQANASGSAITVDKAKTSAGGSNSDGITMNRWYSITDVYGTAQAAASDAWVKGTAAASITGSATGSGSSGYRIELDADELGDGYNWVQVEIGASNAANFVSVDVVLSEPRFDSSVALMPTALV